MDPSARHLAFHGSIVLLFGLLCGAPYGRAINRNAPAHTIHAWRVAHASLPIGAILMFAVAALLPTFAVENHVRWFIAIALIVSAYSFCFSLPLAALTGHRGLSPSGTFATKLVFAGNMLGSVASLAASLALVYAGYVSLLVEVKRRDAIDERLRRSTHQVGQHDDDEIVVWIDEHAGPLTADRADNAMPGAHRDRPAKRVTVQ